jgi:RimJ/RimL family protein N-acetyltransferase
LIDSENLTSIRVARKNGYREFKRAAFNERPTIFFERQIAPR